MSAVATLKHSREARRGFVWFVLAVAVCLSAPQIARAEYGPHGKGVRIWADGPVPNASDICILLAAARSPNGQMQVLMSCTYVNTPALSGFYIRKFDGDGVPLGPQTQFNWSTPTGMIGNFAMGVANSGNFVLAWTRQEQPYASVYAQRFDASLNLSGTEFRVNAVVDLASQEPVIGMRVDGSFIILFKRSNAQTFADVFLRVFGPSGDGGNEVKVNHFDAYNQDRHRIQIFQGGTFLVTWQTEASPSDNSDYAVAYRLFDSAGTPMGDEQQVNTTTQNYQGEPEAAIDPGDGRWVITFTNNAPVGGDDGLGDVRLQSYRADGSKDRAEERVNFETTGRQGTATPFFTQNHQYVVYFENATIDGNQVFARHFSAAGVPESQGFYTGLLLEVPNQFWKVLKGTNETTVMFFNNAGTTLANPNKGANVRVFGFVTNPIINQQPQDSTVCAGTTATLSVAASGTTLSYQWYHDGQAVSNGASALGTVSGAQTATLAIANVTASAGGKWNVEIYEAPPLWGETISNKVTMTVVIPPTATVSGDANLCASGSTQIQAVLTGTGPWQVTWSDNFVQNNVQTSPATRTVNPSSTTVYTVTQVRNANCIGTSSGSATVQVLALPTASVSGSATICGGGSTLIQAVLTGTGPWQLLWSDGFSQTVNASPATRTVSPSWTTTYSVTSLSDAHCSGSATGSATVTLSPTALVSGSRTICAGSNAQIQAILTGVGPWTLNWSDGFVQSGVGSSPATRLVSPGATTAYTVTSVSDSLCTGVSQGQAAIAVEYPPTPATVGGPQTICARTSTGSLGGNTPVSGVGQWTVVSGGTGTFLPDASTPGARFVHNQGSGPVRVRWTITSAACNQTSSADVLITILPSPSTSIIAPDSVCAGATGQPASVPPSPGTTYFWRVLGGTLVSGQGTTDITWNAPVSGSVTLEVTTNNGTCFSTGSRSVQITQSAALPGAVKPQQAAAGYSESSLEWTAQPFGRYRVYFDTVNPPQKILADNLATNSTAIPVLFPSTTYYWQVVATNPCGASTSPVYFFVSGPCPWTITPSHTLEPALATLDVPADTSLQWSAVPAASHYDIRLSTSPITPQTPVFRAVPAPLTAVDVNLNPGTKYYWNVTAVPGCGTAAPSVSLESWFQVAASTFGLTAVTPAQHFRYAPTNLSATGSGMIDGMALATDLDGRAAGPFTTSTVTPSSVSGVLGANLSAPAGRYDVALNLWGSEVARIPAALSVRAFRDVNDVDFYFLSSARMADAGIMEADYSPADGIPDFAPSTSVTRALMAQYLASANQWWRTRSTTLPAAVCIPSGAGSTDFPDVPCGHPQWLPIHWLKAWGVTNGAPCAEGFCFLPNNSLTRGEMVTFLERLRQGTLLPTLLSTAGTDPGCSEPWPACSGWTDPEMQTDGWPRREVNVAFADRMTTGCAGSPGHGLTMCVMAPLTRGEIAEFLARAISLVPTP